MTTAKETEVDRAVAVITERFAFEMAKKDGEIARLTTQLAAARAEVMRLLALCGP